MGCCASTNAGDLSASRRRRAASGGRHHRLNATGADSFAAVAGGSLNAGAGGEGPLPVTRGRSQRGRTALDMASSNNAIISNNNNSGATTTSGNKRTSKASNVVGPSGKRSRNVAIDITDVAAATTTATATAANHHMARAYSGTPHPSSGAPSLSSVELGLSSNAPDQATDGGAGANGSGWEVDFVGSTEQEVSNPLASPMSTADGSTSGGHHNNHNRRHHNKQEISSSGGDDDDDEDTFAKAVLRAAAAPQRPLFDDDGHSVGHPTAHSSPEQQHSNASLHTADDAHSSGSHGTVPTLLLMGNFAPNHSHQSDHHRASSATTAQKNKNKNNDDVVVENGARETKSSFTSGLPPSMDPAAPSPLPPAAPAPTARMATFDGQNAFGAGAAGTEEGAALMVLSPTATAPSPLPPAALQSAAPVAANDALGGQSSLRSGSGFLADGHHHRPSSADAEGAQQQNDPSHTPTRGTSPFRATPHHGRNGSNNATMVEESDDESTSNAAAGFLLAASEADNNPMFTILPNCKTIEQLRLDVLYGAQRFESSDVVKRIAVRPLVVFRSARHDGKSKTKYIDEWMNGMGYDVERQPAAACLEPPIEGKALSEALLKEQAMLLDRHQSRHRKQRRHMSRTTSDTGSNLSAVRPAVPGGGASGEQQPIQEEELNFFDDERSDRMSTASSRSSSISRAAGVAPATPRDRASSVASSAHSVDDAQSREKEGNALLMEYSQLMVEQPSRRVVFVNDDDPERMSQKALDGHSQEGSDGGARDELLAA